MRVCWRLPSHSPSSRNRETTDLSRKTYLKNRSGRDTREFYITFDCDTFSQVEMAMVTHPDHIVQLVAERTWSMFRREQIGNGDFSPRLGFVPACNHRA